MPSCLDLENTGSVAGFQNHFDTSFSVLVNPLKYAFQVVGLQDRVGSTIMLGCGLGDSGLK